MHLLSVTTNVDYCKTIIMNKLCIEAFFAPVHKYRSCRDHFFSSSNYPKCNLILTSRNLDFSGKKVSKAKLWFEKAIKMYV